jgi:5-methylcytosine-specific restriction endonuclease McrA
MTNSMNSRTKQEKKRKLVKRFGSRCMACGKTGWVTLDHIIPTSLGGDNSLRNLQLLCISCNEEKDDKVIDYKPARYR